MAPYYDKISEAYSSMHQYDSALYYMQKHYIVLEKHDSADLKKGLEDPDETDFNVGQIHLIKNEYDKALKIFFSRMKIQKSQNDRNHLMETLTYIGEAYIGKGDYANALVYATKLLDLAQNTGARQYIRDGTKQIWQAYDHLQLPDSAYKYYRQYIGMRDSVSNYRFISQMTSFKETATKEKRELQYAQELEKQSFIRKNINRQHFIFCIFGTYYFQECFAKTKE